MSTDIESLTRRLREAGRQDLLDLISEGKLSTFAAAVAANIVRRRPILGGGSSNQAKRRAALLRGLSGAEPGAEPEALGPGAKMELQYGPSPNFGSYFNSREELDEAWKTHRDELLARCNPGRRPAAFYEFEWSGPRPAYAIERSTLWRAGLLTEAERTELEAEWKAAFDGVRGDGRARREHLEHHDVPAELVREWAAERRGRRRVKRAVKPVEQPVEAPQPAAVEEAAVTNMSEDPVGDLIA